MALKLPEWLDKTFLEAALQGKEDESPKVTVEHFTPVLAVAAGNNYTSQIIRIKIKYKTNVENDKFTTLIVKAPHTNFQEMEGLAISDIFTREPQMYNSVLPKMKKLVNQDFSPTSYYSAQKNVLVFQDLKEDGYSMCDKFKQLDYPHCEIVIKALAKFHSASVVLHGENPEEIKRLGAEFFFVENNPMLIGMEPLMSVAISVIKEALKESDDGEETVQFILGKQEKIYKSVCEIMKPKHFGLNVLNHGDLWINNIMFKHSNGEVKDVKFIDYQVLRYMSPAIDLLYFTWTSADEEVRETRLHDLYNIYLETLNDQLEQLGCEERYTSEELWQDMKSYADFALLVVCQTLPFMLAEEADAVDMAELDIKDYMNSVETGAIDPNFVRLYHGKQFKAKIPKIMKQIKRSFQP